MPSRFADSAPDCPRDDARAGEDPVENAELSPVITLSSSDKSESPTSGEIGQQDNPSLAGHGPARGYSWPPFEKGNTTSLRHGVYSERSIEAKASIVREALLEVAPWLDRPEYLPAVARFIRVEARALLAHEHIEKVTAEQGFGKVSTRLLEVAVSQDRLAAQLGNALGLDPLGQARIAALATGAEVGQANLADLAARGQELVDAHYYRQLETQQEEETK